MPQDQDRAAGVEAERRVVFKATCAAKVNFASAQNDVAVLHSLVVENRGDRPLDNLEVVARAHPPVLAETRWTIDRVAAGSEVALRDLATRLDIERLARLDEAEVCELVLSVTTEDGHTEEQRHRLELLARDEWGGVNCPIRVVQVDC